MATFTTRREDGAGSTLGVGGFLAAVAAGTAVGTAVSYETEFALDKIHDWLGAAQPGVYTQSSLQRIADNVEAIQKKETEKK